MSGFADLPIGRKLLAWNVVISAVTLALASSAFLAYALRVSRSELIDHLGTQAEVAGETIAAALVFEDPIDARQTLGALAAEPDILAAAVYDRDGNRFADYARRPGLDLALPVRVHIAAPATAVDADDGVVVVRPVLLDRERVGSIVLRAGLGTFYAHAWAYAGLVALVFVLAGAAGVALAWWSRRVIAEPILQLAATADRVSRHKDYTVRAAPGGEDEIGRLIEAFNEMLQQIERRDQAVARARDEAEAANRAKDEFLAVVSHELRTPLSPIINWTQLLRSGRLDAPTTLRALDTIDRSARAQAQIVEDLLDVSRILAGKIDLALEPVAVAAVVDGALDAVRAAADAKRVQLQTAMATPALRVTGDAHRLQQVLWNLLSNAVKFTPEGGTVTARAWRDDGEVAIAVEDTGQGIPATFLPHVFDRFSQADPTSRRAHGGLGLGLAIVRHLVDLHGGRVEAASDGPGRGATFTVRLRAAAETVEPVDARPPAAAPAARLAGTRVLVVDDEPDTLESLRMVLDAAGADVRAAPSVETALAVFQAWAPDVVVSDIAMPRQDGYALIEAVRRTPRDRGGAVPAIALTAYAGETDRRRALDAGYSLHVAKPVEPFVLVEAVASLRPAAPAPERDGARGT